MAVVATLSKGYGLDYMWRQTGDTELANVHLPAKRAPGRRYAHTRQGANFNELVTDGSLHLTGR
jgi:hypothetical protein